MINLTLGKSLSYLDVSVSPSSKQYISPAPQFSKPPVQASMAPDTIKKLYNEIESKSSSSAVRLSLDSGYKALGKVASDTVTGPEWAETVGYNRLSREDLVMIIENKDGEFTSLESDMAKATQRDRISAAMEKAYSSGGDYADAFKAAVDYLDEAGPAELGTLSWAKERASAQKGYELVMKGNGKTPEDLNSGNSIVSLFLQAYDEQSRLGDINSDVSDMPKYKEGIREWHKRQATASLYN